MAKKIWEKGLKIDVLIEEFTVGNDRELDITLAKYDILGNKAHCAMLASIGLLSIQERDALLKELDSILSEIEKTGTFVIEEGVEDVHSQVEHLLTQKLGDTGKKIHSGRSRNDQVLLDLKLFFKDQILETGTLIRQLFDVLITRSEQHKSDLMPGYTHTQAAMPSSFGLWFGAYAESLIDDMRLLEAAFAVCDQNPLGSGAGYGSSFPLDREFTTKELGFSELAVNSVYAQMGRGKTEQVLSWAMASVAGTLNKFASDVCLFNSQNFGFINLPDELTTGSSIMPHKKNPDVFELIRARTNRLRAVPNEIELMRGNLISGYHRDFQLLKELLFPALKHLRLCLEIAVYSVPKIIIKQNLLENALYAPIFSVERVNQLVARGVPFRDAYKQVAGEADSTQPQARQELQHTHIGSIGNPGTERIIEKMEKASGFLFGTV